MRDYNWAVLLRGPGGEVRSWCYATERQARAAIAWADSVGGGWRVAGLERWDGDRGLWVPA